MVVIQIALIDMVFSLDSVFTAVGLARPDQVPIMAAAIVLSVLVMMWAVGPGRGADRARYPTIKVLALAFLVLIGAALVGEALELRSAEGLPVLRHGVLGGGGADQHPAAPAAAADPTAADRRAGLPAQPRHAVRLRSSRRSSRRSRLCL